MCETNHLPVSERRRLAKKSQSFRCDDCGMVASLLKPHNDTNSSEAEAAASEAKEIIKTMTLKVKHQFAPAQSWKLKIKWCCPKNPQSSIFFVVSYPELLSQNELHFFFILANHFP